MKLIEFKYGDYCYRFEGDRITKKYGSTDYYDYVCPVHSDLHYMLDGISDDKCKSIMEAILHGYFYGIGEGKKEKIREFKRVLDIN